MRTESQTQRKLLEQKLIEHRSTLEGQHDRLQAQVSAKQAEIEAVNANRRSTATEANEYRKMAAEEEAKAAAADKAGDTRAAEEAREQATRFGSVADVADRNFDAAERDLANLRVELAERQRDSQDVSARLAQGNKEIHEAEAALDQYEDQARFIDEAARKLSLAAATDNVVEQADAELAAEKAYAQARAIDVDEAKIGATTGRQVSETSLPDPTADLATNDDALGTDGFAQSTAAASTDSFDLGDVGFDGNGQDALADNADATADMSSDNADSLNAAAPETGDLVATADATALTADTGFDAGASDFGTDSSLDFGSSADTEMPGDAGLDDGADLGIA
jgi:hypothetical protein